MVSLIVRVFLTNIFFSLKGEALFAPFVVRGGESHTDARDETARLINRRRGHHIAKAEATTRT